MAKSKKFEEDEGSVRVSTTRVGNALPNGIHRFQVVDTETRTGPSGPYWNFTCEVASGPFEGQRVWTIVSHSQQSRFKMDEWLDAFDIPEDEEVDDTDFQGSYFRGEVKDGIDKNGKKKSNIVSFLPDEEPKKKSAPKVRKAQPVEEEDDDDTAEDDEDTEPTEEDLDDEDADVDEDDDDTDEDDEDDEDEDEPEPEPAPKKGKAKVIPAKTNSRKTALPADVKGKPKYKQPFGKSSKK